MTHEIETLLESLARLADDLASQRAHLGTLPEDFILTDRMPDYLSALELAEENIAEIQADTEAVRKALKEAVIESGESHKLHGISAVLVPGRTKWDTRKLAKAVSMHPWLLDFHTTGEPYVQIKGV